jgi:hypothetical protein
MATSTEDRKLLKASLDNLFRMRDEYMLLDMRSAKPEAFKQYNHELYYIGLAITHLNDRLLGGLTAEMSARLPEFESATRKVAADLYSLRRTSDVLNAVSRSMSTITSMVTLFKSS